MTDFPNVRISSRACASILTGRKSCAAYNKFQNTISFGNWDDTSFITYIEVSIGKSRWTNPEEISEYCLSHETIHWVLQEILGFSPANSGGIDSLIRLAGIQDENGVARF